VSDQLDSMCAVCRFADDDQVRAGAQQRAQRLAAARMVVCNDEASATVGTCWGKSARCAHDEEPLAQSARISERAPQFCVGFGRWTPPTNGRGFLDAGLAASCEKIDTSPRSPRAFH
jgi:hypothetical protein